MFVLHRGKRVSALKSAQSHSLIRREVNMNCHFWIQVRLHPQKKWEEMWSRGPSASSAVGRRARLRRCCNRHSRTSHDQCLRTNKKRQGTPTRTEMMDSDSVSASHCAQKASKVTFLVNSKNEKAVSKEDCAFKTASIYYSREFSSNSDAGKQPISADASRFQTL